MERRNNNLRTAKRVALVLAGFAAGALFYKLDGQLAQGCGLLRGTGWVVLELLRPVVAAGLASVQAYVPDNSALLQHLPQIAATLGSLLCGLSG